MEAQRYESTADAIEAFLRGEHNPPVPTVVPPEERITEDFAETLKRHEREEILATAFVYSEMGLVGGYLDESHEILHLRERFHDWKLEELNASHEFLEDVEILQSLSLCDVSAVAWSHYENAARRQLDAQDESEREKAEIDMRFWGVRAEMLEVASQL